MRHAELLRRPVARQPINVGCHPCRGKITMDGDQYDCAKPVSNNKRFCAACFEVEYEKAKQWALDEAAKQQAECDVKVTACEGAD